MATHDTREAARQLTYPRLYVDGDGESHFTDEHASLGPMEVPGAPPFEASEPVPAEGVTYARFEPGYTAEEHPTAAPTLCIVLSGEMVLTASDGESRTFPPGSYLRMEDTTGKGHAVEFPSDAPTVCALLALSE
jgi:quercetin dioxygenase-like cupin family protein